MVAPSFVLSQTVLAAVLFLAVMSHHGRAVAGRVRVYARFHVQHGDTALPGLVVADGTSAVGRGGASV